MTYKIKTILSNSLIVEYRTNNGTLKELYITIDEGWDKQRIEEEIALQKQTEDKKDTKLNLADYFSKGEELEFVAIKSEEEKQEESELEFELQLKEIRENENQELLSRIIEYRNTEVNYDQVRWYSYPSIEEQLDALYWMRQGVMDPIQEVDRRIEEVKQQYPKNEPTNLTCGDLDTIFADQRPTEYLDMLRSKNIQADFL